MKGADDSWQVSDIKNARRVPEVSHVCVATERAAMSSSTQGRGERARMCARVCARVNVIAERGEW